MRKTQALKLATAVWALLLLTTSCKTIVDGRVPQSCVVASPRGLARAMTLMESDCRDPRSYALDATVFSEALESPEKVSEVSELCFSLLEGKECWEVERNLFSTREAVQASPDRAGAKEYNYEEYRVVLLGNRTKPLRTFVSDVSFEKALSAASEHCLKKTREETP